MELKEISLITFPNGVYQEMGFNWEAHCVEDLYVRNLMPYSNKHIVKMSIILIGDADKQVFETTTLTLRKFTNLLSVGEIFLRFDFDNYYKTDDLGKKRLILDVMQEGLILFANQTNSDVRPFNEAYQKCLDLNLESIYVYKTVTSGKGIVVNVVISVDREKLEVSAIFLDSRGNEFSRRVFFRSKPDALYGYHYLGNVVWNNESEVALYGRTKDEYWTISFLSPE